MVIQRDTALWAHPVPSVNINSLNERGAGSGSPCQADNEHFITSLSLNMKKTLFF